jgi:hypothetical protein
MNGASLSDDPSAVRRSTIFLSHQWELAMSLSRFSIRGMILLVAIIAVGCFIAQEFQDGLPPRFILRRIPGRIEQLRPGMTRQQTYDLLGLKKSWIRGGIGATFGLTQGGANRTHETFYLRPNRPFVLNHGSGKITILRSAGMITLRFHDSPGSTPDREDKSAKLERAAFSVDGHIVAEMPDETEEESSRK